MDALVVQDIDDAASVDIDPKGIAFLQYTSGSTGSPKGVMVSHENIVHNEYQIASATENDNNAVLVSWLPFYHDMGLIGNVLQSLAVGGQAVLMSPTCFLRKPLHWLRALSDYKGTMAGAPNFAYDLCVEKIKQAELDTLDLSSWKTAFNGAEPIKIGSLERFHEFFKPTGFRKGSLFPCYGLAEGTLYVSGGPFTIGPMTLELDRDTLNEGRAEISSLIPGSPDYAQRVFSCVCVKDRHYDQLLRIVDPKTWMTLQERQVGEIWVKSPSIAQGYWNNPRETAATFQAYTTDQGEGPFMRTGDLGFMCDGQLYVTGRIKELIIINGVNYYPQDIEHTVQDISDGFRVHCGAAFNYDDNKLAIVHGINRSKAAPHELQNLIEQIRRAVFQVHGIAPTYIGLVNPGEISKTSSGKIQRSVVKQRFLNGEMPLLDSWRNENPADGYDHLLQGASEYGASGMDEPPSAQVTAPSAVAQQKIVWLENYFTHRINSYLIDERRTIPPYVVLDLGNQGLLGMQVPKQYGGLEFSTRDFLSVMEAIASKDLTLALFVGLNNVLGIRPVLKFGTKAIKDKYLPLLASGRELAAFALTEPSAGSNPQAIHATASPSAGNTYRIQGTKYWSGSAAWCGLLNVFAKTVDSAGRVTGMSAFAVPQSSNGLRQGPEALTMGMRGMVQNTVFLDDVEVDESHMLGKPGQGMNVAQDAMCYGRLTIAATCLGGMKRCYQIMLQYAGNREIATGRLIDNPYTLSVLTETMHAINALAAFIDDLAIRTDQGETVSAEILAICKSVSTEWLWKIVDRTMQMAGGRGYIETNCIPQLFRDARILRIFEGPTETLNHFVGSSALKKSRIIREYLNANLDEATVAEYYDAVLKRVAKSDAGNIDDAAMHHWHYLAVGNYMNQLVLYAVGSGKAVDLATRQWLLGQVQDERLQLDATQQKFDAIRSVETVRSFGKSIDLQLGQWAQVYPGPELSPDPLLVGGPNKNAPIAARTDADAPSSKQERPRALTPVHNEVKPPASHVPSEKTATTQDIQSFLSHWIAQRCKRPIESISADIEFAMLGLGSVDSVDLSVELSERYALELEPTILWNYPRIRELVEFIASELALRQPRIAEQNLADAVA